MLKSIRRLLTTLWRFLRHRVSAQPTESDGRRPESAANTSKPLERITQQAALNYKDGATAAAVEDAHKVIISEPEIIVPLVAHSENDSVNVETAVAPSVEENKVLDGDDYPATLDTTSTDDHKSGELDSGSVQQSVEEALTCDTGVADEPDVTQCQWTSSALEDHVDNQGDIPTNHDSSAKDLTESNGRTEKQIYGHVATASVLEPEPPNNGSHLAPGTDAGIERRARARSRSIVERPIEDPGEYVSGSSEQTLWIPDGYRYWNRAIAEYLLLNDAGNRDVYLTVTPRILAAASASQRNRLLTPEEAEADFIAAVSQMYLVNIASHRGGLRRLRTLSADNIPNSVAFLAISVLAAYQMRSDEEAAGNAYYLRLANLLRSNLSAVYPDGFDPADFESLWLFVKFWLQKRTGAQLVIPDAEPTGYRRYVALPLAHVPLRYLDIEKLPDFFLRSGYQPGAHILPDTLASDLMRWHRSRLALTSTGAAALGDDRRSAVLAQVAGELESWDGSVVESVSRRSANVELMLDFVQRRVELFYLPRRPAGFPDTFRNGHRLFESSDDGWYDPVPVSVEDGDLLSTGFEWSTSLEGIQIVLRRSAAHAIALTPSEYSSFLSHSGLVQGAKCAVLCQQDLAQNTGEFLSAISKQTCRAISDPNLPSGWVLFSGLVPRQSIPPPAGLESLAVDSGIEVVLSGGLRVGRRSAWIIGAPPRILVTGLDPSETVTLDGDPVRTTTDGFLHDIEKLSEVGEHVVAAGAVRRRIETLEPSMDTQPEDQVSLSSGGSVVALPSGHWTLIGQTVGEVAWAKSHILGGTLAQSNFEPVWAIQVGAGPGAAVISVGPLTRPKPFIMPKSVSRRQYSQIRSWISTVHTAAIRRPRVHAKGSAMQDNTLAELWIDYAAEAKRAKRKLKKT